MTRPFAAYHVALVGINCGVGFAIPTLPWIAAVALPGWPGKWNTTRAALLGTTVKRVAGPGETVVVPIGVRHSESNPGAVAIEGVVELRPALHTKELFEAFAGLGSEGKTTARGAPKNPLQLGATLWHFRHESRATSPPISIQNLVLPPLAALAKLFGVRPYQDRWDSRISKAD
jgi:hypothetical protein